MYRVELDGVEVGKTALETGDPPMGVVCGLVRFTSVDCPYSFFMDYCSSRGIPINQEDGEIGFIETQNIDGLKVFRSDGVEIAGIAGASICGFREDGYHITILGVPHPFYADEFPALCKTYAEKFADK